MLKLEIANCDIKFGAPADVTLVFSMNSVVADQYCQRRWPFLTTDEGKPNMSTLRNAVLALISIQLTGCAVGVKPVYGPDGQQAHAITCSDLGRDWSDCFEKAGEICGARGYKVWNQSSSQSAVISGSEDSIVGGTSQERTLLIGCK